MKTALIYNSSQNLSGDLSYIIAHISGIHCENSPLTLIPCDNTVLLPAVLKSALKKNDTVFLTNSLYREAGMPAKNIFGKMNIIFNCFDDGNRVSGFIAKNGKKTLTVLTENIATAQKLICNTLCFTLFASNDYTTYGSICISELEIPQIKSLLSEYNNVNNLHLRIINKESEIKVFVFAAAASQSAADALCDSAIKSICAKLGDNVYDGNISGISETVVGMLLEKNIKIGTAESCTAGMLSTAITSVPNSSRIFEIGISSYSCRIKQAALGVSAQTIDAYGAVSSETAAEMAQGIRNLSDSDLGLGITGVAGPDSIEGKSVGTVYIALCDKYNNWVVKFDFGSDSGRNEIRRRATFEALELIRRYLVSLPNVLPGSNENGKPVIPLYCQPQISASAFCDDAQTDISGGFQVTQTDDSCTANPESTDDGNADIGNIEETDANAEVQADGVGDARTDDTPEEDLNLQTNDEVGNNEDTATNDVSPMQVKNKFGLFFSNIPAIFSKPESVKRTVANCVFALLIVAIVASSVAVTAYFRGASENSKILSEIRNKWHFTETYTISGKFACIDDLQQLNADIKGWVKIGDTQINNPICQSDKENYYNNRNHLKKKSRFGSLHFPSPTATGTQAAFKNTVILGNNCRDGSMFGTLKEYKRIDYLRANPFIDLVTENEHKVFEIFSVMIVDSNDTDFNFAMQSFNNDSEYDAWLNEVKLRSLYKTESVVASNTNTVTLITDSSEFKGAKLVVVGFDITDNNSLSSEYKPYVSVNPSPKYPQVWYDMHKADNPYKYYNPVVSDTATSLPAIPRPDTKAVEETAESGASNTANLPENNIDDLNKNNNNQKPPQSTPAASSETSEPQESSSLPSQSEPTSSSESSSETSSGTGESGGTGSQGTTTSETP